VNQTRNGYRVRQSNVMDVVCKLSGALPRLNGRKECASIHLAMRTCTAGTLVWATFLVPAIVRAKHPFVHRWTGGRTPTELARASELNKLLQSPATRYEWGYMEWEQMWLEGSGEIELSSAATNQEELASEVFDEEFANVFGAIFHQCAKDP